MEASSLEVIQSDWFQSDLFCEPLRMFCKFHRFVIYLDKNDLFLSGENKSQAKICGFIIGSLVLKLIRIESTVKSL